MGILDKARDRAEQLIGETKEKIGKLTGNGKLENAGKRDQLTGEVKEAVHDLPDKAAAVIDDARDKLTEDKK